MTMPITYHLDDERRRITVTVSGLTTVDDILALINRQIADQTWAYALLYDFTEMPQLPETADVARIADHVRVAAKQHGRRGPVAVVSRHPEVLGTARQYSGIEADTDPVAFFTTRHDAERWLSQAQARP